MSRIKCTQCRKRYSNLNDCCPRCNTPSSKITPLRFTIHKIVLISSLGITGICGALHIVGNKTDANSYNYETHEKAIPSLDDLLGMSSEELEKQDIAMINLVCAKGLHGAENINIRQCLRQIDIWAYQAEQLLTEREFMYYKAPEKSNYSINRWRCSALGQFLSQIIGLSYHPGRRDLKPGGMYDTHHFKDSRDFMIHGLILDKNRGTCASMPVLYTAIARRLGYPVKLVTTRHHLFSRWVDPEGMELFNIEWTDTYVDFRPDEYYKNVIVKLNVGEVERQGYLTPLSARRAMSCFMHLRGSCLWFHKDLAGAKKSYTWSYRLDDNRPVRESYIRAVEKQIQLGE